MKKLFFILLICCLPLVGYSATTTKESKQQILSIMDHYDSKEGVESVKIGKMALAALRGAAKVSTAGDKDSQEAIDFLKKLKNLYILDYSSCSKTLQNEIDKKVVNALKSSELLMESSEGGNKVKIYGDIATGNNTDTDFIIYSETEHGLMCLSGAFTIDELEGLKNIKK